jgi:hypothetical protein
MIRLSQQPSLRVLAAIFVIPLLILVGVTIVVIVGDLNVGDVTRDPVTILGGYPLVGALSAFGVILWWFTFSVCLFTFALARSLGRSRSVRLFLLTSGLFTLLLAIDDQFLIHDDLASRYLGMREREVMAIYLLIAALYVVVNRAVIRRSEWIILGAALVFFASSIAFDYLVQMTMTSSESLGMGLDWAMLIEDGLKLMGIAGWSAYLLRFSYFAVTREDATLRADAGGA